MQDNSGGLDAETFSYCSGRSDGRMRACRPVDGPKCPRYRIGYDGRTGTSAGPCRDDTGARRDNTGTRRHDNGSRGDDIGTRRHGAGDDPERPTDEEKEDDEDDAAAGDR
jgi:hypothetical protein